MRSWRRVRGGIGRCWSRAMPSRRWRGLGWWAVGCRSGLPWRRCASCTGLRVWWRIGGPAGYECGGRVGRPAVGRRGSYPAVFFFVVCPQRARGDPDCAADSRLAGRWAELFRGGWSLRLAQAAAPWRMCTAVVAVVQAEALESVPCAMRWCRLWCGRRCAWTARRHAGELGGRAAGGLVRGRRAGGAAVEPADRARTQRPDESASVSSRLSA